MIKVIYFFRKKPGLSVEDFQTYWRQEHSNFVSQIPEVRRYVQCHTLLSGYQRETPPAIDGTEELCFDGIDDFLSLEKTPAAQASLHDLSNFVDTFQLQYIRTEEAVVKEGSTHKGMVKNIEFLIRKPDIPLVDFHRYWLEIHGPLAAKIEMIRRYVQSHTLLSDYTQKEPPPYDGVAETWFDDTNSMRSSALTPEYATLRADEKNFISEKRMFVITRELKFI